MSFTPFLASVARALTDRVHPTVTDRSARDALEACIRAIAGMAAALEPEPPFDPLQLPAGIKGKADPRPIVYPPENLAANNENVALLEAGSDWLARGSWLEQDAEIASARVMLNWERDRIRDKVARMIAMEGSQESAGGETDILLISRDALERYFAMRCGAGTGAKIVDFRQVGGGRSRQTAVFTLEGDTGLPRKLVVQRDHPAGVSPFGVADQYPVLEVVAKSRLKTPRPVLIETDPAAIGAPFMIMEHVSGEVAGPEYFDPPKSPQLARELAEQLAILHAIDPSPLFGKIRTTVPRGGTGGWADDLQALELAWESSKTGPSLAIAAAFAWMRAHVEKIGEAWAIVHNDTAFHNVLAENGRFSALLDWELVHIGHPAEDLGYSRPFIEEITDWDDFMAAYTAAGGRSFDKDVIDYFSLRGGIHLMVLMHGGRGTIITGATTDINMAEVGAAFIPKHHGRISAMVNLIIGQNA